MDTLKGGEGNDGMYTGSSQGGDTINGGGGDDVAVVDNTSAEEAEYNINMGSGIDMSNYTNRTNIDAASSIEVGMYNLGGLQAAIDKLGDAATSDAVRDALDGSSDVADFAAGAAADTVKSAFLTYMSRRGGDNENIFGAAHSGGFQPGDIPPATDEEESET